MHDFPAEIILIRHGQSEANIGDSDDPNCPVTPTGLQQARQVGERLLRDLSPDELHRWSGIVSPYLRTQQTAAEISAVSGLAFEIDPAVREWGATATINGHTHPQEQIQAVVDRLEAFLHRKRGQRLVIVSHATPVALITQMIRGEPLNTTGDFWAGVENCCLRRLMPTGNR